MINDGELLSKMTLPDSSLKTRDYAKITSKKMDRLWVWDHVIAIGYVNSKGAVA